MRQLLRIANCDLQNFTPEAVFARANPVLLLIVDELPNDAAYGRTRAAPTTPVPCACPWQVKLQEFVAFLYWIGPLPLGATTLMSKFTILSPETVRNLDSHSVGRMAYGTRESVIDVTSMFGETSVRHYPRQIMTLRAQSVVPRRRQIRRHI